MGPLTGDNPDKLEIIRLKGLLIAAQAGVGRLEADLRIAEDEEWAQAEVARECLRERDALADEVKLLRTVLLEWLAHTHGQGFCDECFRVEDKMRGAIEHLRASREE